jgi:hypothetical protein
MLAWRLTRNHAATQAQKTSIQRHQLRLSSSSMRKPPSGQNFKIASLVSLPALGRPRTSWASDSDGINSSESRDVGERRAGTARSASALSADIDGRLCRGILAARDLCDPSGARRRWSGFFWSPSYSGISCTAAGASKGMRQRAAAHPIQVFCGPVAQYGDECRLHLAAPGHLCMASRPGGRCVPVVFVTPRSLLSGSNVVWCLSNMDRIVYDRMAAHDTTHWWYRARREILSDYLKRYGAIPAGAQHPRDRLWHRAQPANAGAVRR